MTTTLIPEVPSDHPTTVVLDPRNNGPRRSSNGGFAAGTFAQHVGGTAWVRLMAPPPLGTPLTVDFQIDGATFSAGPTVIATARRTTPFVLEPPVYPSMETAKAASLLNPGRRTRNTLSDCIVCGPDRADGMHVVPGPLSIPGQDLLVAPFIPHEQEAVDGVVRPEAVWGALDCPSYPAALMRQGKIAFLGELTAHQRRDIRVGEQLVVVGWTIDAGTRSHRTATAIIDADDEVVASAHATWVVLKHQALVRFLGRFA
jgi:hypothetical protein